VRRFKRSFWWNCHHLSSLSHGNGVKLCSRPLGTNPGMLCTARCTSQTPSGKVLSERWCPETSLAAQLTAEAWWICPLILERGCSSMKGDSLMYAAGNQHCREWQSQNKGPYLACRSEPLVFPKTCFAFRASGLRRAPRTLAQEGQVDHCSCLALLLTPGTESVVIVRCWETCVPALGTAASKS